MSDERVLITGASGFVGSAIVACCREEKIPVRATGRRPGDPTFNADYFAADLAHDDLAPLFAGGIGAIVHAAGLAHQFRADAGQSERFQRANVDVTRRLMKEAIDRGVKHFVLISSVSVYGSPQRDCVDEETPCVPSGPYMETKWQAENAAKELARGSDCRLTILRLATVYGEGDPGNVARLMRSVDRGRFVWIGRGENRKSLIHREDVARACVAVLRSSGTGIDTFNLTGPACAMRDIVQGMTDALQRNVPGWRIPERPILASAYCLRVLSGGRGRVGKLHATLRKWLAHDEYSGEKFNRRFAFQPRVTLREGLQREADWYRQTVQRVLG